MEKIPVLFERDSKGLAIPKLKTECSWVALNTSALASIKIDGVCVKVELIDNKWTVAKRMSETHYMRVNPDDFMDKILWDAFNDQDVKSIGIFEVYGKGIKNNPHNIDKTYMIKVLPVDYTLLVNEFMRRVQSAPNDTVMFDVIKKELEESPEIEGIVFHLERGMQLPTLMAKIRKKDFGIPWPSPSPPKVDSTVLITGVSPHDIVGPMDFSDL